MLPVSLTTIIAVLGAIIVGVAISAAGYFLFKQIGGLQAFQPRGLDQRGYKAERNRLKLEIASIRANVWALLIISIVGVSQLGFEIWRLNFSEQPYTFAPAIEDLLRSRLPDGEALERQHRQLIQAIRESRPPNVTVAPDDSIQAKLSNLQSQIEALERRLDDRPVKPDTITEPSPAASSLFSLVSAFIVFSLLACTAAVLTGLYFLRVNKAIPNWFYRAATATVTLGSLISGVTLLKEASLVKSAEALIKINVSMPRQPEPRQPDSQPKPAELHLHLHHRLLRHSVRRSASVEPDCGKGDAQRVGPFKDGRHLLEDAGQEKLRQVMASLVERSRSERLTSVTLAGSGDKREPKPLTARIYGSNAGLAQARIKVVRDELERAFEPDTLQIMNGFSGPTKIGTKVSADDLAFDRAVQICVYWGPKT